MAKATTKKTAATKKTETSGMQATTTKQEDPTKKSQRKRAPRKSLVMKAVSGEALSHEEKAILLGRAFRFLSGLGLRPMIMTHLVVEGGFSETLHREGWDKLNKAGGLQKKTIPVLISREHEDALRILDAWDEPNFMRAEAALQYQFPEQYEYLFEDLKAAQGIESLNSVKTFLQRIDTLEKGSDPRRKGIQKEDKAAVQRLVERKIISTEIRGHLWQQIAMVESSPTLVPNALAEERAEEKAQAFRELASWYGEWSKAARAILKKRSHLISLGLASRRSQKNAEDESTEDDLSEDEPEPDNNPITPDDDTNKS